MSVLPNLMRRRRLLLITLVTLVVAAIAILVFRSPAPSLTEANYQKIRLGMTEQDVLALLGEPLAEGGRHRPFGDSVAAVRRTIIDVVPAGATPLGKARDLHWWDSDAQLGTIVFIKADGTVEGKMLMSVTPNNMTWLDAIRRRLGI
jgi:hypothetical protein